MLKTRTLTCLFLLYGLGWARLSWGWDDSPEAKVLADKFLQHLAHNAPVAGVFEVRRKTEDMAWLKDHQKKIIENYASQNRKVTFNPSETVRIFDWAWDGSREKCHSLDGSNVIETFYSTPEAYLDRVGTDNYNLNKPDRATYYRPASFYFLAGITPWRTVFEDAQFDIKPAPEKSPSGTVLLIVRSKDSQQEWRIVLHPARHVLHGYQQYWRGKTILSVVITAFAKSSDHRLYPSSGQMVIYDTDNDKPIISEQMSMRKISFPTTKEEIDASLSFELPANTSIMDRNLNRLIVLKKPTTIQEVLSGNLPSVPIEEPSIVDVAPARASRKSPLVWFLILNFIVLLLISIYSLSKVFRGERSRS